MQTTPEEWFNSFYRIFKLCYEIDSSLSFLRFIDANETKMIACNSEEGCFFYKGYFFFVKYNFRKNEWFLQSYEQV